MNNSLLKVTKEMKRFLKKNKSLRYSLALVLTFLMSGELSIADSDLDNLDKTVKNIQSEIKKNRKLNKKKIYLNKMELMKLMEEGDHIVKSPWTSYQFEIQYKYHKYNAKREERTFIDSQGNRVAYGSMLGLNGVEEVQTANTPKIYYKGVGLYGGNGAASAGYGGITIKIPEQPYKQVVVDGGIKPKAFPNKPKLPNISVNPTVNLGNISVGGSASGLNISSISPVNISEPTVNINVSVTAPIVNVNVTVPTVVKPQIAQVGSISVDSFSLTLPNRPVTNIPGTGNGDDYRHITSDKNGYVSSWSAMSQMNILTGTIVASFVDGNTYGNLNLNVTDYTAIRSIDLTNQETIALDNFMVYDALSLNKNVDSSMHRITAPLVNILLEGNKTNASHNMFFFIDPHLGRALSIRDFKTQGIKASVGTWTGNFNYQDSISQAEENYMIKVIGDYNAGSYIGQRGILNVVNVPGSHLLNEGRFGYMKHEGKLELTGSYILGYGLQNDNVYDNTGDILFHITGDVIGRNKVNSHGVVGNQILLSFINDTFGHEGNIQRDIIFGNEGKVELYAPNSIGLLYTSDWNPSSGGVGFHSLHFMNDGVMDIYGRNSVGLMTTGGTAPGWNNVAGIMSPSSKIVLNKPINVYGDSAIGAYITKGFNYSGNAGGTFYSNSDNGSILKFTIGEKDNTGTYTSQIESVTDASAGSISDPNTVDNSIGFALDLSELDFPGTNGAVEGSESAFRDTAHWSNGDIQKVYLSNFNFKFGQHAKSSAYIVNIAGELYLDGRAVGINNGTISDGLTTPERNSLDITQGEKVVGVFTQKLNPIVAAYSGNTWVDIKNLNINITDGAEQPILFFAGKDSKIMYNMGTATNGINAEASGAVIAYATDKGVVDLTGKITLNGRNTFSKDSVALYSKGANSRVNLKTGSILNITGIKAHAIMLEASGEVDVQGTINVKGNGNAGVILGEGGDLTKLTGVANAINIGDSSTHIGGIGVYAQGASVTKATFAFPTSPVIKFNGGNITAFAIGNYVNNITTTTYTNTTLQGIAAVGITPAKPNILLGIAGDANPAQNISITTNIINQKNDVVLMAITSGNSLSTTGRAVTSTGTMTVSDAGATNNTGVYITNKNIFKNEGTIKVGGNSTNIGIVGDGNSTIDLSHGSSIIDLSGNGTGIVLSDNSVINGEVKVANNAASASTGIGVYVDKAADYTSINNITEQTSTQNVALLTGVSPKLINNGTLTVIKEGSVGLYTGAGLTPIISNTGTINVTDGIGVMIDTATGKTVESFGTINLNSSVGKTAVGVVMENNGGIILPSSLAVTGSAGSSGNSVALYLKGVTSEVPAITISDAGITGKIVGITGDSAITTSTGTIIDLSHNNTTYGDVIGIYQKSNSATNKGTIKIGTKGVGMFGDTANITNTGVIEATNYGTAITGDFSVGMMTKTANVLSNTGLISVNNASGNIDATIIGMYASRIGSSISNTGTIELNNMNSIAMYVEDNSILNDVGTIRSGAFDTGGGISIAIANSSINPAITSIDLTGVNGRVGVYAKDDTSASIRNWNGTIKVGDSVGNNKSVALYYTLANTTATPYEIHSSLISGKNGVGLYLKGLTAGVQDYAKYRGTITVGNGGDTAVGIYMTGVKLNLDTGTININEKGGTAFYVGQDSSLEINGLVAGINLNYNADGTIAVVEGGAFSFSASNFNINENGYKVSLGMASRGVINVTGNTTIGGTKGFSASEGIVNVAPGSTINSNDALAIALYAQGYQNIGLLSGGLGEANNVEIYNEGAITLNGNESAGIVLEDAKTINKGNITIGNNGYGIYAREVSNAANITNDATITIGENSVGIFQNPADLPYRVPTGSVINNGTINSSNINAKGLYILSANGANVNNGNITLSGTNSVGIWADTTGIINNTASIVMNEGTALYSNTGSAVINSTGNLTVGNNGKVAFAKDGGKINITGGTITTSGGLFYAVGAGSEINMIGGSLNILSNVVADNFIVATGGGKVDLLNGIIANLSIPANGIGFYTDLGSTITSTGGLTINSLDVGAGAVGKAEMGGSINNIYISNINLIGDGSKGIFQNGALSSTFNTKITSTTNGNGRVGYFVQTSGLPTINLNEDVVLLGTGDGNVGFMISGVAINELSIASGKKIQVGNASSSTNANAAVYFSDPVTASTLSGNGKLIAGSNSLGVMAANDITISSGLTFEIDQNSGGVFSTGNVTTNGFNGIGTSGDIQDMSYGIYGKAVNLSGSVSFNNLKYGVIADGAINNNSNIIGDGMRSDSVILLSGADSVAPGITIYNNATISVTPGTAQKVTLIQGKNINITNDLNGKLYAGDGGVAIYGESIDRHYVELINNGEITVGKSTVDGGIVDYSVGIGLVTDVYNPYGEAEVYRRGTGKIINNGKITVEGDRGIGLFGTGYGTEIINLANTEIILKPNFVTGSNTIDGTPGKIDTMTGIYLNKGAKGYNYGTIRTDGTLSATELSNINAIVGVVVYNDSTFENMSTGVIDINAGDKGIGIIINGGSKVINHGTINVSGGTAIQNTRENPGEFTDNNPSSTTGRVLLGEFINYGDLKISGNSVVKNLLIKNYGTFSADSGVTFEGLMQILHTDVFSANANTLSELEKQIGDFKGANIPAVDTLLDSGITELPENRGTTKIDISDLVNKTGQAYSKANGGFGSTISTILSHSLTWQVKEEGSKSYYEKLNYGDLFVDDANLSTFGYALDQLYVNGNDKEQVMFNMISKIDNGGVMELTKTFQEMLGTEYSDIQSRMKTTNKIYDRAIRELNNTENLSKDSNKFKIIAEKGDYENKELLSNNHKYVTTGFIYMNDKEKTTLKEGKLGYYGGILYNETEFDKSDLNSKEKAALLKFGVQRSKSIFENRSSLKWDMNLGASAGIHKMEREFTVYVDGADKYKNKADYYTYGISFDNAIKKDIRLNKLLILVPSVGLDMSYGGFTNIKEDENVAALKIKGNDYYEIAPNLGLDINFSAELGSALKLNIGLRGEVGYNLGDTKYRNKAEVLNTTVGMYDLVEIKNDREYAETVGKIELENSIGKFGVYGGYSTDKKEKTIGASFTIKF